MLRFLQMPRRFAVLCFVLLLFAPDVYSDHAEQSTNFLQEALLYRSGLQGTIDFVKPRQEIFQSRKLDRLFTLEERELAKSVWKTFLDYLLALDTVSLKNHDFHSLERVKDKQALVALYTSFLAQYRYSLEFIEFTERNKMLVKILNEPLPELGLPKGSYDNLRMRYLKVDRSAEFSALDIMSKIAAGRSVKRDYPHLIEDAKYLWKKVTWKAQLLTAKASVDLLKKTGFTIWFPIQTGAAEFSGDTKVKRIDRSLVTSEQIAAMLPKLEPGDVLLERREWYLSNVGLPGYWPHAALYIGTAETRKSYFQDPEVIAWVRSHGESSGSLNTLLQKSYPQAYQGSQLYDHGHVPRVLEAISEGVSFTSLEHSASADSVAVIRPRLSKKEKAIALYRAFRYAGRPYDFNFDFVTDSSLVCTELIFKAYEPESGYAGLKFPVLQVMGRRTTPANELVRQFDQDYSTARQQSDFVLFLDGYEKERRAKESNVAAFRTSWKRPKWYILVQHRTQIESQ